jgi:hypothetical protein
VLDSRSETGAYQKKPFQNRDYYTFYDTLLKKIRVKRQSDEGWATRFDNFLQAQVAL